VESSLPPELKAALDDLYTRSAQGPADHVLGAQPFCVPEDADLLEHLEGLRAQERRHATMLAKLFDLLGLVPEAGVFPYWYRDLNYLTVPTLAAFVVEALEDDVGLHDAALRALPAEARLVRATLEATRAEKAASLDALRPRAAAAREREARAYEAAIEARAARTGRARPKRAAPDAALPDPDEPGIPAKERAKRQVMRRRAQQAGAAPAPAAAAPSAPGLPDPDEPGISAKERAKRQVMRRRAQQAGAAPAPATPAPSAPGLPDPDEPGITAKERARRQVLRQRARRQDGGGASG
jgi:hypothetical protein